MLRSVALPRAALIAALMVLVAACGGAASPAASTPASVAPSAGASVEPSSAAPSEGASAAPSIPFPSLPNEDKDLEALLPNEFCGEEAFKTSMTGATFLGQSPDEEFLAVITRLGKTPADLAVAAAGNASTTTVCDENAAVIRVKGADPTNLQAYFLEEARKQGSIEEKNLGGKTVWYEVESESYAYFYGDAVFVVSAPDEAAAAAIFAQLP